MKNETIIINEIDPPTFLEKVLGFKYIIFKIKLKTLPIRLELEYIEFLKWLNNI